MCQTKNAAQAEGLLDDWLRRAAHGKTPKVVEVEKKARRRRGDILRPISPGVSNGRVESVNNKIKVAVKMGRGLRNTDSLIALMMLRCSDVKPQLPWKQSPSMRKAA